MVTIRPMAAPDIDPLMVLERMATGRGRSRAAWQREQAAPAFAGLVAQVDGEIAGFLCYHAAGGEASLNHIAVSPARRRQGIARALMERFLADMRHARVEQVFLDVRRGNRAALALYAALGFERVAVRNGYYQDPVEDALILRIPLEAFPESR